MIRSKAQTHQSFGKQTVPNIVEAFSYEEPAE